MDVFNHILEFGDDEAFVPEEPETPTNEMPGTKEKLEAMAARVAKGEDVHHKLDRNYRLRMTESTKSVTAHAVCGKNRKF